jgi:adenine/guanine/hypoxanthine permease
MIGGDMKYWVKSDWNGFFGLFSNNLTNLLVMASLLSVVVGLPFDLVYGRILPAVGLSIFLASAYYTKMAVALAKKTQRTDVTALPSGASVPHMFLIVFLIIGPVYWSTGNAILAWSAGLVWSLVEGLIELLGALIGAKMRQWIPRAAMLGSLAGVSLTFIALNPAFSIFALPYIGLVSLAIVLLGFIGKVRMPFNIPTGLVAIVVAIILGWSTGVMKLDVLIASFDGLAFALPLPSFMRWIDGFTSAAPFLIAAIPLGIYNFIETIDNCESAAAAGDEYNTQEALVADGLTSIIGSFFGSPFPTAIFIGHPGWKEAGARLGYSFASGLGVLTLTSLGIISVLLNIIPVVGVLPILLYIGLVITSQAFSANEHKYAPAVVMAIVPSLADWTRNAVDIALSSANTNALTVGYQLLNINGLNYEGMFALGQGAIIVGMVLGSLTVFIIDRQFVHASVTSLLACILSFFGIIHSAGVGLNMHPTMSLGYLGVSIVLILYHQFIYKKENIT